MIEPAGVHVCEACRTGPPGARLPVRRLPARLQARRGHGSWLSALSAVPKPDVLAPSQEEGRMLSEGSRAQGRAVPGPRGSQGGRRHRARISGRCWLTGGHPSRAGSLDASGLLALYIEMRRPISQLRCLLLPPNPRFFIALSSPTSS